MADHDTPMPFLGHLKELRQRLIYSVIALLLTSTVGYLTFGYWSSWLLEVLLPPEAIAEAWTPLESFITKLKFSLILGIFYGAPILTYHCLAFLMPALTKKERRYIMGALFFGVILFAVAIYYCLWILPNCVEFLKGISLDLNVNQKYRYSDTLMFGLQILLAFSLVFQCPVILFVMMGLGLVTRKFLLQNIRMVVVAAFLLSALITPPDVMSQILLALPLIGLYFLTIFIAYLLRIG